MIVIYKRDHNGNPVWHYTGEVIQRTSNMICIQARFIGKAERVDIGVMVFERGDLMTEWFYSDRYYNVFKIQAHDDGRLKGWYCNIARPAQITEDAVIQDDLALDVFVHPDGRISLMDEDEFASLRISSVERQHALKAVESIRQQVKQKQSPFDECHNQASKS